ncbi:NAD-dependent epimerase/dehydratase family protein [Duganella rhizosphaerae]|uniref:NAD-dependent epimerase/dehydratase family protein n=1 Tax=Duganella rhizosphaerae TaxID=2885763 RepID=UPI00403FB612
MNQVRVGLIGAGRIAREHLEALQAMPGIAVSCVVDSNRLAAAALADRIGAGVQVYTRTEEALAAKAFERAHVLVPPHLHAAIGESVLRAGVHCLMEKPMCVASAEGRRMLAAAESGNAVLGVNQNFIFHPALLKFRDMLDAGHFGRVRFVSLVVAVPLAQLKSRQFGHWMFERPSNIILEQMVHPLSQLIHFIGPAHVSASTAAPSREIAPGVNFHKSFDVTLKGALGDGQLHMAFGASFPVWQLTAVCDDGVVAVDCIRNSISNCKRTRFLEAADIALSLAAQGAASLRQSIGGVSRYLGAQLKLRPRTDAFHCSIRGSVQDFHRAIDEGRAPLSSGQFGANLVDLCEQVARLANVSNEPAASPRTLLKADLPTPHFDVAVLGGTGFIGRHVVRQLLDAGYSVGVMGRNVRGAPDFFSESNVTLVGGDVGNRNDIARGIGSAKYVVNLVHGGTGATRQQTVDLVAGAARAVGEVCLEKQVERLVFVSSIAAVYLGKRSETILPSTPCDQRGGLRSDYSLAKAAAERVLLDMHRDQGLPVTIQRPGIVVGEGASPFHSGLGLFNNDEHCLGWNGGRNPLPFVLVEDVASAIVSALKADAGVLGRTDNIVGGVRLSAREYFDELKPIVGRPLTFHPQSLAFQLLIEWGKWLIKTAGGNKVRPPNSRDFLSRGMPSRFDTTETEAVLNWAPVCDRRAFIDKALVVPVRALLD